MLVVRCRHARRTSIAADQFESSSHNSVNNEITTLYNNVRLYNLFWSDAGESARRFILLDEMYQSSDDYFHTREYIIEMSWMRRSCEAVECATVHFSCVSYAYWVVFFIYALAGRLCSCLADKCTTWESPLRAPQERKPPMNEEITFANNNVRIFVLGATHITNFVPIYRDVEKPNHFFCFFFLRFLFCVLCAS